MKIVWHRRDGKAQNVPPQVEEDAASTIVRERRFSTWMDEIIARHEREGGFDQVEGKGKPLNLSGETSFEGTINRIFGENDVVPEWVRLRREILADLQRLQNERVQHPDRAPDMGPVNDKIRLYNRICPHSSLQRPPVSAQGLKRSLAQWE